MHAMSKGWLIAVLLLAGGVAAAPVGAEPVVGQTPVAISGVSPFPSSCGVDMSEAGFGDDFEDAEVEPHLAINPVDPSNIVAAWMQDLYQGLITAASHDGGATWTTTPVPGTSTCSGGDYDLAADPWLSFAPDGRLYLSSFSLDLADPTIPLPVQTKLTVRSSTDGGLTWTEPAVVIAAPGTINDKPAITADPNDPCVAYVVWTEFLTPLGPPAAGMFFSRTEDCGMSWSLPALAVASEADGSFPIAGEVLVLPSGNLVIVATMLPAPSDLVQASSVLAVRSTDGGATWSLPVTVAQVPWLPFPDPERPEEAILAAPFPSADLTANGTLYVTWRHPLSSDAAEIRLSKSVDEGLTWGAPGVVSAPGAQTFMPVLAVQSNGTVGVTYYDLRNDVLGDEPLTADVWFAHSHDGGASWAESHLAGPFDLRRAPYRRIPVEGRFIGDYSGLTSSGDRFAAAFALASPQSTAGATDIFFAELCPKPGKGNPGTIPTCPPGW